MQLVVCELAGSQIQRRVNTVVVEVGYRGRGGDNDWTECLGEPSGELRLGDMANSFTPPSLPKRSELLHARCRHFCTQPGAHF
jgi:hypothetical protein